MSLIYEFAVAHANKLNPCLRRHSHLQQLESSHSSQMVMVKVRHVSQRPLIKARITSWRTSIHHLRLSLLQNQVLFPLVQEIRQV